MSEMHSKRKTEEVVRRDDGEKEENCGRLTAVSKIGVDIRAPGLFLQSSTILRQSITHWKMCIHSLLAVLLFSLAKLMTTLSW